MVFVSKIYLASLVMLGSYQECVFIMSLEGFLPFFFFFFVVVGIGYEIGSLSMTREGFGLSCIGYETAI